MIYALIVPSPGKDVIDVRVLEWHAQEGRRVLSGELIVELETHKVVVEVRAAQDGFLRRRLCAEGEWRRVGEPLAMLSLDADSPLPESADGLPPWQAEFQTA